MAGAAMSRQLSVAILVLAVLAVLAGIQFTKADGATDAGCTGVRQSYERVSFVEKSGDVPTAKVYADVATTVRRAAATAPPAVVQPVSELADAYVQIGSLLTGFDPDDASTYHVYEDSAAVIERQQAVVDTSLPKIREWLDSRCG
jgi:hypothetical protein